MASADHSDIGATSPQNVPRAIQPQSELPTSSTPLEMSSLSAGKNINQAQSTAEAQFPESLEAGRAPPTANEPARTEATSHASNADLPTSPATVATPTRLTRFQSTAIGPSSDEPMPLPKDVEETGPTLMITLLLINGARHPFKLDTKYLNKRNVEVQGNDPFNLSVYKLKELILREWREGLSDLASIILHTILTIASRVGSQAVESKLDKTDIFWKAT
jgi:hypothetical protein